MTFQKYFKRKYSELGLQNFRLLGPDSLVPAQAGFWYVSTVCIYKENAEV